MLPVEDIVSRYRADVEYFASVPEREELIRMVPLVRYIPSAPEAPSADTLDGAIQRLAIDGNPWEDSDLPDVVLEDHNAACSLCYESFVAPQRRGAPVTDDAPAIEPLRQLPCSPMHVFHAECADLWLKKKDRCPLCNKSWRDPCLRDALAAQLAAQSITITEGGGWHAVFKLLDKGQDGPSNMPRSQRLDIELVHTIRQEGAPHWMCFSPDGQHLAVTAWNGVKVYDVETGALACTLTDSADDDLYTVHYSPDGQLLVAGLYKPCDVLVWQVSEQRLVKRLSGHTDHVRAVDVSSDDAWLVSGSDDATVKCWSMPDGSDPTWTAPVGNPVFSLKFFPHSQLMAAGLHSGDIHILNASTGSQLHRLQGHRRAVRSFVFTHDGQTLLSSSYDHTLKYWDVGSLTAGYHVQEGVENAPASEGHTSAQYEVQPDDRFRTLTGHKDWVRSITMLPDEQWIISGSDDGGVHFWDRESGKLCCRLNGHNAERVFSIARPSVGGLLATGSEDGLIRTWKYRVINME